MRTVFFVFVLAELASLAAYFIPILNMVGFFVIVAAALALSLRRLEYGLYFVLADLILGGKTGALFSFEYGGFLLSLRMALFIVVMSVWVGKVVGNLFSHHPERSASVAKDPILYRTGFFTSLRYVQNDILRWWGVFGLAVAWGIVVGLWRGNDFGNLFLDANGYFYGALILPAWWVFHSRHSERSASEVNNPAQQNTGSFTDAQDDLGWRIFFTATTLLALKTLFSVYLFTHGLNNFIAANLIPFYRWIRDTGVGEITWLEGNFARVFFQSHVYNILGFFGALTWLTMRERTNRYDRNVLRVWMYLVLNTAVIVVSLSRSFWVGVIVGLIVLGIVQIRKVGKIGRNIMFAGVAAVVLLFLVARFPFPRPSDADLTQATQSRFQFEAGAASRWNLLPVMWSTVREYPIVGSGFGRTITYISNDPRVRASSVTGEYETYAFEWGWLDFWLKLGIVGLVALLGLIFAIARALYRGGGFAGLAGLVGLTAIHFFTPYLNHPLGFGVLIGLTLIAATTTTRG